MAKERSGGNVRLLRVGENIRHALSDILSRDEVQDPELVGVPITVSEVQVSPDLRHAIVYVVPLGGERAPEVVQALNRAAAFLRGRLAGAVHLKYLPKLVFRLDETFAEADRVERILRSEKVRRDLEGGGEG